MTQAVPSGSWTSLSAVAGGDGQAAGDQQDRVVLAQPALRAGASGQEKDPHSRNSVSCLTSAQMVG